LKHPHIVKLQFHLTSVQSPIKVSILESSGLTFLPIDFLIQLHYHEAKASRIRLAEGVCEDMTFLQFSQFDAQFTIVNYIYEFLPIADIVALTQTCKLLSSLYKTLLPS